MEQATTILAALSVVLFLLLVFTLFRLRSARRSKEEAESTTRNLREKAPYGLLTVNRDTGTILGANPAATELLGLGPTALEGKTVSELLATPAQYEPAVGFPLGLTKFSRGDGSTTYLSVEVIEEDTESGSQRDTTTLALTSEATRVRAEAALEDLEDRYREVISHASALVYTIDLSTGEDSHDGAWLGAVPGGPELPVNPEDEDRLKAFREALGEAASVDEEPGPETEPDDEAAHGSVIEYRLTTLEGGGREIQLREEARAVSASGERPPFIRGVILDITRLKEIEDKLDEALGMKRAMTRSSVVGIAVRSEGRLFEVNPAGAGILGSTPEELTGRVYLDFIHPDSERVARAGVRRTDRGDEEARSRMTWLRASGQEVEVEVFAIPLRYTRDEQAALLFFEDVTLRERTKRREVLRIEDLDRRNARLEQFVRAVSLDLAVSLTEIEAAVDPRDTPDETVSTEALRHASGKMGRTVEELSSLASVPDSTGAGEEVDLSEVSRSASKSLGRDRTTDTDQTRERSVEVIVAGGLIVSGDRKTLTRAMTNLIENAWRAAGTSPRPRIVVGSVERAGEPVFFVRDNGPGFDMAHAGSLFDPMRDDLSGSGYGEGLPAASRIIERHGGHIWAESEPGKGATFYFTL